MELVLNIYDENGNIIKTYKRESYSIRMRLLKKIIYMIDLDTLTECLKDKTSGSDAVLVELASQLVKNGYDTVQELMKDIFKGLTDEEYLDTFLEEITEVVINLAKFAFATIGIAGKNSKNVMREV